MTFIKAKTLKPFPNHSESRQQIFGVLKFTFPANLFPFPRFGVRYYCPRESIKSRYVRAINFPNYTLFISNSFI